MSTVSSNNVDGSPLDVLQDTLQLELISRFNMDEPVGFDNVTCSIKTGDNAIQRFRSI